MPTPTWDKSAYERDTSLPEFSSRGMDCPPGSLSDGACAAMKSKHLSIDQLDKIQAKADRVAWLMDDMIVIPGTRIRLGWDGILGVIPGIGDLVTLASHLVLITQAMRVGARKRIYGKMLANAAIDFVVGIVPVVGDVLDVLWRANRKNADLLREEIARLSNQ